MNRTNDEGDTKMPKISSIPAWWLGALLMIAGPLATAEIRVIDEHLSIAGQPSADELRRFAAEGGTHVIDLRGPGEDRGYDEAATAESAGMRYHNLPITGPAGLTRDNVQKLDRLLAEAGDGKTLLHCASANRVGALMALRAHWLQGASMAEALEIGRRHGLTSLQPQVEALLRDE
jgi:uncharacterized protein (TIGR01244 family)